MTNVVYKTARLFAVAYFFFMGHAAAAVLTPGNVIVVEDRRGGVTSTIKEYDLFGNLVQDITIPSSRPGVTDGTSDVVVDAQGRIHVFQYRAYLPSSESPGFEEISRLATLDPVTNKWTYTRLDFELRNGADADLAILGNRIFTKNQIINLDDFSVTDIDNEEGIRFREIVAGLDGNLYGLGVHPILRSSSYELAGVTILDGIGTYGGAVLEDGTKISGGNSTMSVRSPTGETLATLDLRSLMPGVRNLTDIEADGQGNLLVGGRFGAFVLLNTLLEEQFTVQLNTDSNVYGAFVPHGNPVPLPPGILLFAFGLAGLTNIQRKRRRSL